MRLAIADSARQRGAPLTISWPARIATKARSRRERETLVWMTLRRPGIVTTIADCALRAAKALRHDLFFPKR